MRIFKVLVLAGFVVAAGTISGCDWVDSDGEEEHIRPEGLVLEMNDEEIVTYENGVVTGQITVAVGAETDHIHVHFLDADGEEIEHDHAEDDHDIVFEVGDETIAEVEQHEEDGHDEFHVLGKQVGTTTLRVHIGHGDHFDFSSKNIPIEVTEQ